MFGFHPLVSSAARRASVGSLVPTMVLVVAMLPVAAVRLTASEAAVHRTIAPQSMEAPQTTSPPASPMPQNAEPSLKTFYLAHADAQEVTMILNQMLTATTSRDRPVITMSKSANAILVRATPATLELIQNIIAAVDAPVRPGEAPMTDASLIAALKSAATITSDVNRANALIALGQRNLMTLEMVSLYVTAASGIASDADRARVFAQPIRLKPPAR